ncbi:hypothetical protein Fmac_016504 [Flemingia macrophylla]|uniref:Uncharacterized protein n=1 Tax=Flemingia macrophylla TaxID=520843 RepID=A0ABD1MHJ7_9FABA
MCENRHILALCEQKLCVHPSIIMLQLLRAMASSNSSRSPCSQLKLQPASILFWCFTINYKVEQSSGQVTSSSAFNLSLTQPPNSEMTHFRCCQILPLPNLPWLPMMAYLFPR